MPELRQDPITRDWVIVNPARAARPSDGPGSAPSPCPFCPGNEHLTPDTTDRIDGPDGRWRVRAVANKFPALRSDLDAPAPPAAPERSWRSIPGFGYHEVIVETPEHRFDARAVTVAQTRRVLEMYARRYDALARADARLRQVVLFRNHGVRAGTSLSHPHSQVIATPVVSPETRRRVADEIAFFDETGACGMCHVVERELALGARVVLATAAFATLAPFAARGPFHLQIVPLRHTPAFPEVLAAELDDLAAHLTAVLAALHAHLGNADYNLIVATPPLDLVHRAASHWFIEILPRITTPAGFELGSRIVIDVRRPEDDAHALRAALAAAGPPPD